MSTTNQYDVITVSNKHSNHEISYYVKDNDIYLCNLDIDWDDMKTFASMIMSFCNVAHEDKIKNIRQLIDKGDYQENKKLYALFTTHDNNNGTLEIMTKPLEFPMAMFTALGLYNSEDKTDKKF